MTCMIEPSSLYVYELDSRKITLQKDLVDKYSKIVCPVTEKYLSGAIRLYGKDKKGRLRSDEVLSSIIATDMVKELDEYGAFEYMDWNQAIKDCPSNIDGKCQVLPNNRVCTDNISNGKCPIKQLQELEVHKQDNTPHKLQ